MIISRSPPSASFDLNYCEKFTFWLREHSVALFLSHRPTRVLLIQPIPFPIAAAQSQHNRETPSLFPLFKKRTLRTEPQILFFYTSIFSFTGSEKGEAKALCPSVYDKES